MAMRPKIYKLAKMIAGVPGMLTKITEESPEYYSLACVTTDEQADVALTMGLRKPKTMEQIAALNNMTVEQVTPIMEQLLDTGVAAWTRNEKKEKEYYVEIFAPGVLEHMMGNAKQVEAHPEIAKAFHDYTRGLGENLAATLPPGSSLMRVIPVQSAVDGSPKTMDIEKISYYLDKYDIFSVSDCSCRATREIMGEGCGHLKEDMCLHLGYAAEYYAETGKAHYVTKEEAIELLKRAEENGLVHSLTNIYAPGRSDAICNCCSCACFGLRLGVLFGARDAVASNFRAEVTEDKCVACGQCVEVCPANAVKLGQKLPTKAPLAPEPAYKKIINSAWKREDWDEDYRINKRDVVITGTAPCKTACPAHIAVQGYLRLAAQGKYRDALELIKKDNPFPAVCGRICNHRCETECMRGTIDQAVAIDEVKRFIADQDLNSEHRFVPKMLNQIGKKYPEKIAIIGAGPAGMTCAYYLAVKGYTPVVFDKSSRPGGMLMNGIPSFRLEKDVVQAEIDILKEIGVEFRMGVEVGKDITLDALRKEGFKAFYLAIGLQGGGKLNIPGEDVSGVRSGIDFLKDVNLNGVSLSGNVVVIGGGSIAADTARTAIRCGASKVSMYSLESEEEMPCGEEDKTLCRKDGVEIHPGWGPMEITSENGAVTGIKFKRCTQVKNAEGKFDPKYDEAMIETASCTTVLYCIGQRAEWGQLLDGTKVVLNGNKTASADGFTYQTAEPDIFVGGDIFTGQKFVIDAIAAGKEAAISLHRFVKNGQTLTLGRDRHEYKALDKANANVVLTDENCGPRQQPGYNEAKARTFGDERVTFTPEQIRKETSRCLGCGASKVDQYLCIGCGLCTTRCKFDAIHLEKKYDNFGMNFEVLPLGVAKNVVKRTGRIIGNAFSKKD